MTTRRKSLTYNIYAERRAILEALNEAPRSWSFFADNLTDKLFQMRADGLIEDKGSTLEITDYGREVLTTVSF